MFHINVHDVQININNSYRRGDNYVKAYVENLNSGRTKVLEYTFSVPATDRELDAFVDSLINLALEITTSHIPPKVFEEEIFAQWDEIGLENYLA